MPWRPKVALLSAAFFTVLFLLTIATLFIIVFLFAIFMIFSASQI